MDKKLDERLDNLTNQFTELKVSIGTDVSTLTKRVGELEAKLDLTTVRVEKLEDVMKMPAEPNKTVLKQLEDMQAQIETLRQQKTNSLGLEHERTMVVGGLAALEDKDKASEWLVSKLKAFGCEVPEVYTKGETFNGILFAKFKDSGARDAALRRLKDKASRDGGREHWAKPDLPLEPRVLQSFLFGAKYLFAQWGFAKTALWVDVDKSIFYFGNAEVARARITDGTFSVTVATDWEKDLDDADWKKLVETAKKKLEAVKGKGAEKGKGKQPVP